MHLGNTERDDSGKSKLLTAVGDFLHGFFLLPFKALYSYCHNIHPSIYINLYIYNTYKSTLNQIQHIYYGFSNFNH